MPQGFFDARYLQDLFKYLLSNFLTHPTHIGYTLYLVVQGLDLYQDGVGAVAVSRFLLDLPQQMQGCPGRFKVLLTPPFLIEVVVDVPHDNLITIERLEYKGPDPYGDEPHRRLRGLKLG
jgi:hypothetical protein